MISYGQYGTTNETVERDVLLALTELYFRFMQKIDPDGPDRKWVTDRFIGLIWPLLGHSAKEAGMYLATVINWLMKRKFRLHDQLFLFQSLTGSFMAKIAARVFTTGAK